MKNIEFLKGKLIAHRGVFDNKRIYENTASAYIRAIKYHFPIELDVRILKDGTIICFHDEDMERLLHLEGKVEKLTYDELVYIAKYQIPTFASILELVNGEVPLLIETKSLSKRYALEQGLAKLLDNYQGEFAIQSFYSKSLKWFYKNRPNYIIGYIMGKRNYKQYLSFKKFDFLDVKIGLFSDKHIRKIKEDYPVIGWDIDSVEDLENNKELYYALVCDNILDITNK